MRGAGLDFGIFHAEVAAEDEQVFSAGEVGVEVVELRHDANACTGWLGVGGNGMAAEGDLAAVRRGQAEAEAQRGRFAGTVGAEQAKARAWGDGERQTGNDFIAGVAFAQRRDGECRRCAGRRHV